MRDSPQPDSLPFVKMHGAGNDFVIVRSRNAGARLSPAAARNIADRHLGVGCDQVVEVGEEDGADLRLTFFNADGSVSAACGNATRCVASLEMDARGVDALSLQTARGPLRAERRADGAVWVNMGPPVLDWRDIPLARPADIAALPLPVAPAAIGMGNPHAVHFVENAEAVDLETRGPAVERDPLFPERTNVEFASLQADGTLRLRVWERGAGVTLACGSGACATAVAAHRAGLTGRAVALAMDGGMLHVDWRDDGVWLTGPVARVFDGTLTRAALETAP